MGAVAPSLRSITPSVATNAAIVLHGHFVPIDHTLRAMVKGSPIELEDIEAWPPFNPINPGGERHFLVRPASGSWPASSRIALEVHRLPPGVPRSTMRVRTTGAVLPIGAKASPPVNVTALAHRFEVDTLAGPAHSRPIVGAFDGAYEQTHRHPIHGEHLLLHIRHGAMQSVTSPVLWLEVGIEQDRNEFETWFGGAVIANRPGVLALRPFGGGLIPALVEAKLFDTTGASVVVHPPR
jgi:hypothetical protein